MKRCPECRRDYYDDSLQYCLDDGTTLLEGPGLEAATAILSTRGSRAEGSAPALAHRKYLVPVISMALLTVLAGSWLAMRTYFTRSAKTISSIAVLPFQTTGQDPDQGYLSDGVTESLINSLTQIEELRVINRNSVFRYKDFNGDPAEIGRELGVQAVLTGRIIQRGDSLTVSTELADVADSKQIWGQQYNFNRADIMRVQPEIARQISDQLLVKLTGEQKTRLAKHYTDNTEAYLFYTRGRYFWDKRNAEGMQRAREAYKAAIELDTNYALAYAGLADSYLFCYCAMTREEAIPLARTYAQKALSIDNDLAEAHVTLAFIKMNYEFDWADSMKEFETAIRLNPSYSVAHQFYAICLVNQGRYDEGIREARRALELDPLSLAVNWSLGLNLYHARKFDEAISQLAKTVQMDPQYQLAHGSLGNAYLASGMYDKALTEFQIVGRLRSADPAEPSVGLINALIKYGRAAEAKVLLKELQKTLESRNDEASGNELYGMAKSFVLLGDNDLAFNWLERAFERHSFNLFFLKVDPGFDPIRNDPRFSDLLKRVGSP